LREVVNVAESGFVFPSEHVLIGDRSISVEKLLSRYHGISVGPAENRVRFQYSDNRKRIVFDKRQIIQLAPWQVFRFLRDVLEAFGSSVSNGSINQLRRSVPRTLDSTSKNVTLISSGNIQRISNFWNEAERWRSGDWSGHDPSTVSISCRPDLSKYRYSRYNRENSDDECGPCIEPFNEIVRWLGGCVFFGAGFLCCWLAVDRGLLYQGWRCWLSLFGFAFLGVAAWWCMAAMIFGCWTWCRNYYRMTHGYCKYRHQERSPHREIQIKTLPYFVFAPHFILFQCNMPRRMPVFCQQFPQFPSWENSGIIGRAPILHKNPNTI